jgi:hypothetical protein
MASGKLVLMTNVLIDVVAWKGLKRRAQKTFGEQRRANKKLCVVWCC